MFNLQITTDNAVIILPKCYYTISAKSENKEITMASGKIVQDIIGTRKTIKAKFAYLPAEDLANLASALRSNKFYDVTFQDIDNSIITKKFKIDPIKPTVFKYIGDTAMWVDIELNMTAQEVDR